MSSPHPRLPFLAALLLIGGQALWSLSPRGVGSGGAAHATGSTVAVNGQPSAWTLEGVDTPRNLSDMTDRSLRLDSQGRPHLVYGGDGLYYARYDGSSWQIEVVDATPGVGRFAALALDGADQPHVSYLDEAAERLRYARWTAATGWQVETVLGTGCGGYHTSIAVDAAGRPHISHQRCGANDTLGYATLDPVTGWTLEIVDGSVLAGGYSSIALDAAGVPRISYAHEGTGELRYAFRAAAGGWTRETVVDLVAGAAFTSLALAGDGVAHVSYLDRFGANLGYAVRGAAGAWSTEVVDGAAVGGHTSIALDASGHPRIGYYAAGGGNLKLATWTPAGGWTLEVVASAGDTGLFTSLVLDAAGSPRISYLDRPSSGLKLASWIPAGGWSLEVVDRGGDPGQYASLATAPDGSLHVGYFDALSRSLRHARWNAAAGWSTETVESEIFVGEYASLALSPLGHPRICYLDRDGRRLKYATWSPTGWTIEVIAGPTLFDTYGALAVDGQDRPHVSYFDAQAGELRYATRTAAAGWSLETIDQVEEGFGGAYSSIAVDGQDRPHVSYVDSAGGPSSSLKYASRDPATGWSRETILLVGEGRGYNALALEASGRAHVAFYDPGTDEVRHGLRNLPPSPGWARQTVASNVLLFSPLSLALTAAGSPRIAYYHTPAGALRYAARDGGGSWSNEPVFAGAGPLGGFPSVDFDSDGRPVIAFYDQLRHDLMAAHGMSNPVLGLAKRVTSVVDLGAGQVDVGLLFTLENLSDVALEDVQVVDLLTTTFPPPSTFAVVGGPTASGTLAANPAYDGGAAAELLDAAGSTLPAFQLASVAVTVRVSLGGASGPFLNSALASARGATGGTTSDTSDDGADPDPNGDDNPDQPGENDPTPIAVPALTLSVGSTTTSVTAAGQVVPYTYQVTNAGSVVLTGISLVDDLTDAPPACPQTALAIAESMSCTGQHTVTQAEVDGGGTLTNTATADAAESAPATASLAIPIVRIAGLQVSKVGVIDPGPNGVVEAGDAIDYTFLVTNTGQVTLSNLGIDDPRVPAVLCPSGLPIPSLAPAATESCTGTYALTQLDVDAGQVLNTAQVTAERPGGPVLDVDASELTVIAGLPVLGVAKQVTAVDDLGGGQVDVGFHLTLENLGNVTLTNVQVTDLLAASFPPPSTFVVQAAPTSTGTLVANPGFDGAGDATLLDAAASTLAPAAIETIGFTVRLTLNGATGPLFNTAVGTAQGASGGSTSDPSHDGADPDPNGDGNPDQPGENDPTAITLPTAPVDVPTLGSWSLAVLSLLLAALAVRARRRWGASGHG